MMTLVTAFIQIYDGDPAGVKNTPFRIQQFEYLASTHLPLCLFVDPTYGAALAPILAKYPNVHVLRTLTLQETRAYAQCIPFREALPAVRNGTKDTFGFLTLMNAKAEFVGEAARANPFGTDQFAWIDFNVFHMFQNKSLQIERLRRLARGRLTDDRILMPSCWPAGYAQDKLWSQINWRFCGAFYMGTRRAVIDFDERLAAGLPEWNTQKNGLTWEVNVWAHLENTTDWRPHTYSSNHNDSLISVPPEFFANWNDIRTQESLLNDTVTCLALHPSTVAGASSIAAPLGEFQPSSSSFVVWKGQSLLNIRYVNYELTPQGAYIIHHPEGHLVTRNVLCPLDPATLELKGGEWEMEAQVALPSYGGTIHGLEDIRLYTLKGCDERGDRLRFIATQREYVEGQVNRMMTGDVDVEGCRFINGQVLEPPSPTGCEKNWIPLIGSDGQERFIYSWSPYRLGTVNEKGVLEVSLEREMPPFFERMRGSTVPVEYNGVLWCVAHYSQETSPRTYFHVLVQLDPVTHLPLRHSQPFVFHRLGIEFCIGFAIHKEGRLQFWFSQHDKDLATLAVSAEAFVWSNIV